MISRIVALRCVLIIIVVVLLGLTGCLQHATDPRPLNHQELPEMAHWVAEELDKTIDATEIPHGWHSGPDTTTGTPWDDTQHPGKADIIRGAHPLSCGENGGAKIVITLRNTTQGHDTSDIAARVQARWEANKWVTTHLTTPTATQTHIRADRAEEGTLRFQILNNQLTVSAHSPCSVHRSVRERDRYYGWNDPFAGTLDQQTRSEHP